MLSWCLCLQWVSWDWVLLPGLISVFIDLSCWIMPGHCLQQEIFSCISPLLFSFGSIPFSIEMWFEYGLCPTLLRCAWLLIWKREEQESLILHYCSIVSQCISSQHGIKQPPETSVKLWTLLLLCFRHVPMVFLLFPSHVVLKSLLYQIWVPGQTKAVAQCIRTTQSAVCSKRQWFICL